MYIQSYLIAILTIIVIDYIAFKGFFTKLVVYAFLIIGALVGIFTMLEYLVS